MPPTKKPLSEFSNMELGRSFAVHLPLPGTSKLHDDFMSEIVKRLSEADKARAQALSEVRAVLSGYCVAQALRDDIEALGKPAPSPLSEGDKAVIADLLHAVGCAEEDDHLTEHEADRCQKFLRRIMAGTK